MENIRLLAICIICLFSASAHGQRELVVINGYAQGTTYQVKYYDEEKRDFSSDIKGLLNSFDHSLSLYDEESELSRFNGSHAVRFTSPYFLPVLIKSKEIYERTGGIFDPTVLPILEAYGFGPQGRKTAQSHVNVDSLIQFVGFNKIHFDSISVRKDLEQVRLDFNAIAQGYSVDLICEFLFDRGIENYLVEVGGELRTGGMKPDGSEWTVGVSHPLKPDQLLATVSVKNRGMATSGNYRNYYKKNGITYTHVINPLTGRPGESDILSVTVFAEDAMTADGYATAFLVMGVDKVKGLIGTLPEQLDVFIVYSDRAGQIRTYATTGLEPYLRLNDQK